MFSVPCFVSRSLFVEVNPQQENSPFQYFCDLKNYQHALRAPRCSLRKSRETNHVLNVHAIVRISHCMVSFSGLVHFKFHPDGNFNFVEQLQSAFYITTIIFSARRYVPRIKAISG